jgi:hypothetical protein
MSKIAWLALKQPMVLLQALDMNDLSHVGVQFKPSNLQFKR